MGAGWYVLLLLSTLILALQLVRRIAQRAGKAHAEQKPSTSPADELSTRSLARPTGCRSSPAPASAAPGRQLLERRRPRVGVAHRCRSRWPIHLRLDRRHRRTVGVARRRLPWKSVVGALVEALRTSAAIFFILIAAFLFQFFLAVTQMSQLLADTLTSLPVGPLGVVSVLLVILQPVLFDTWCTLCLASGVISVLMIGPAMDEVLASLQYVKQQRESGRSLWSAFWGLKTQERANRA